VSICKFENFSGGYTPGVRTPLKRGREGGKGREEGRGPQGLNCQKISGGVDICLFIVISITHRRFSIINNGGGVETDPPRVSQGIMFGGVGQTTGGVQPPNPPAIQTLGAPKPKMPPGPPNVTLRHWLHTHDSCRHETAAYSFST
jgi:hypothetical protein